MKKLSFVLLAVVIFSISACKSSSEKSDQTHSDKIKKSEVEVEVKEVVYPLPTSFELTKMLQEIEASYIFGITNDPSNAEKYFTEDAQALNLGIYTADLAYSVTYNFKQEMFNTLEGIKTLINALDLASVVDPKMIENFEANADDKEELVNQVTDIIYKLYSYLRKQDREDVAFLMVTGSWIEGMYITTNISENTFANPQIVDVIMKQEVSLNKLIELLEGNKASNSLIQKILPGLKEIRGVYDLEEGTQALSKKQVDQLVIQIEHLRESLVN